jgi:outer membrane receptor protein involved in Fe transport
MPDLKRLPNEPEHTVDLELRLRGRRLSRFLGEPELSTVARFRGAALRETSGTGLAGFTSTEHTSSSWVVDVRLQLPIAEVVTLNFDVRNLTDEMTIDSYEIRGRSFFAGLRYRWPHDF